MVFFIFYDFLLWEADDRGIIKSLQWFGNDTTFKRGKWNNWEKVCLGNERPEWLEIIWMIHQ